MAITIRVNESTLTAKSAQITDRIGRIEKALQTMSEQIRSSSNYWEGDASTTHRTKFNVMEADTKQTIEKLKKHPPHLLSMAGLYKETEGSDQSMAQSLSNNVISGWRRGNGKEFI